MGVLSTAPYVMSFDAASLMRLSRLMATAPIFARYYAAAMNASVAKVISESKQRAPVLTGTLRRGITGRTESPWRGVVGVGQQVPYARRREFGFSGMTDALGRFYPHDPGSFYLHGGLDASQPFIRTAFFTATELALRDIAL